MVRKDIIALIIVGLSSLLFNCKKNSPPQASIQADPLIGTVDTEFLFDAGGCWDTETPNDMLQFRWDWESDGNWDTDFTRVQITKHKFPQSGSYQVRLEVMDEDELKNQATIQILISESNHSPLAQINVSPEKGNTSTIFQFDASASSDPETIASDLMVRWDWTDDGAWDTEYSNTKRISHQFPTPRSYQINLEVVDAEGATGTDKITLLIEAANTAPEPAFCIEPTSGTTLTVFKFDGSGCRDNETPVDELEIRWDWTNDGIWDTKFAVDKIAQFQFSVAGTYNITLEVKDSGELTGTITHTLVITPANTPPVAQFDISPTFGTTSTIFLFDASGCSDQETSTTDLQVRWDWSGDGLWDSDFSTNKIINHQYAIPGDYSINLEVKDDGNLSSLTTLSVKVSGDNLDYDGIIEYMGKEYRYKTIGTQTWMIDNLAYLPTVSPSLDGADFSPYYYVYGYDGIDLDEAKAANNYVQYGVLYNWAAAVRSCPSGWKIPSDDDWKTLEKLLGMTDTEANSSGYRGIAKVGEKLKSTTGWNDIWQGSGNGDNSSGFSAVPGGYRTDNGYFNGKGSSAMFWTSSEAVTSRVWTRGLDYNREDVRREKDLIRYGLSVRCIRNQ